MKAYEDLLGTRLQSALDRSIDRAKTLQGQLSSAGIAIFPADHTYHDWFQFQSAHFWGMVASVLFLSLGAHFWFNQLKQLSQLKSAVTLKGDATAGTAGTSGAHEKAAATAAPQAAAPRSAPSTATDPQVRLPALPEAAPAKRR